ncbi:MAG TPA: hypothetical protein PLA50_16825, partial [Bacteroidia bacterium]|nr:hypothetical protein [Bacteroidia bacterium]
MKRTALLLLSLSLVGVLPAEDRPVESRLVATHQSLAWFPDGQGRPAPLKTLADWERRRAAIVAGFEEAGGKLPSREALPELDVQVTERIETERYVREKITFASEAGDRTPAYLYLPKGLAPGERRSGVVALHPTHKTGKAIADGQGERPNRAYAKEL